MAVAHNEFKKLRPKDFKAIMNGKPVLIDIRGFLDANVEKNREMLYYRL
jgi:hypothetical protein